MKSAAAHATETTAHSWAMAAHLIVLSLYLGMIFTNLPLPYLIWRWQKKRSGFAAEHAPESLNHQCTFTAVILASLVAVIVFPWAWLLAIPVETANIVLIGKAADRAKSGRPYRYPSSVRWLHGR